ncbi:MAG TPA: outer membrane protein transport protein [Polyangiaceae bacterium]|jgi:long-chain fatty acid transport protein
MCTPRRALAALIVLLLTAASASARAAGLYFSDRGVRPMGRAGAFVAGADDLGAIWYNPAGLADAGTSFLFDMAWLDFNVSYTRELQVVDAGGAYQRFTSPTIHGGTPILPFPTIAASYNFGSRKEWTVAGGVLAPYIALTAYPTTVDGQPSPARYSMGSYNGSIAAMPGIWLAYKPIDELRFGAGLLAFVGKFQSTITFNANPQDRLLGAPEEPDYDAAAQLNISPIFAPSANGGVTWVPDKAIRFGASGQLPMIIDSPATITMQMPSSVVFDGASQDGTHARVRFVLPAVLRAGVELRPIEDLRVELAYVREFWSEQQSIQITPEGMSLDGIAGMPPKVNIPPITMPRGFQDAQSFRLGGEYRYMLGDYHVAARGGVSYETSAVPPAYLNLSALDFVKWTASLGGSLYIGAHWRFDGVWAHTFASTQYVDPNIAKIPRINPIDGNAPFEPVNGGTYSASADLFGVGFNYLF